MLKITWLMKKLTCRYPQIVLTIIFFGFVPSLFACDMFALIAKHGNSFSDNLELVDEYFEFLKDRSNDLANDDGYGIIAYRRQSTMLSAQDRWYKTGSNTWYDDGTPDVFDEAKDALTAPENDYWIVIAHARNATVGQGSHPFWLDTDRQTFSFCHNGAINYSVRKAVMYYLGENWFEEYPSNWSGIYDDTGSFIDSELYFHYLVYHTLAAGGDCFSAITNAFADRSVLSINISQHILEGRDTANMLFCNGEKLYAFKNTREASSMRLSWQDYGDIIGIRTRDELSEVIRENELVEFSGSGFEHSEILEYEGDEVFQPPLGFYAQPNPFHNRVEIYYSPQRVDDDEVDIASSDQELLVIYDIKGREILKLNKVNDNSEYSFFVWDGELPDGKIAASGIYFYHHPYSGNTGKLIKLK